MAKIAKPEDIFPEIISDYKNLFGQDLSSIILYGSAAGSDYKPETSDLNFLIILTENVIDRLDKAFTVVSQWRKKKVSMPLFMTKSYIISSLDSYPLEFLNMQKQYILVYGEDVLKEITFEPHLLRLQCEREIKGKLLLLREGFLETEGKEKKIKELIAVSITAFISIFNGLLYLKGLPISVPKRDVIVSVSQALSFSPEPFLQCMDIKEHKKRFSSAEIYSIFKNYLTEVRKLWDVVDKINPA